ncbi:MAG: primosomal protein N' [Firmicutes bacterium]|nr:primosomal protein N' [Bacillota bacterium]
MGKYAEVIVDLQSRAVDRPFHYVIPPGLQGSVQPGHRVIVPFGPQTLVGYVIRIVDESPVDQVKPILKLLDEEPLLTREMVDLAIWLADHTYSRLVDALRCILPAGIHIRSEKYAVLGTEPKAALKLIIDLESRAPKQAAVLRYLLDAEGEALFDDIMEATGCGSGSITALVDKGYIGVRHRWTNPAVRIKRIQVCRLALPREQAKTWIDANHRRAPKQAAVIACLLAGNHGLSASELADKAETSPSTVRALEAKGLVRRYWKEVYRDPYSGKAAVSLPLTPNPAQAAALQEINQALDDVRHGVFLLLGVTGSGKTEVYLQAIAKTLQLGKQAIVLVPEIALTPQTVRRFKARFGERVAVLHSALSPGERFDEWRRIRSGGADIAVGARSAVFAPFTNLGLIVIDEEHEQTYKQEEMPRYHARDVALWRAERHEAVVVLGSATPAVESTYQAETETYRTLLLPQRIEERPLPEVEIIDMRDELRSGNRTILSQRLREAIRGRLLRREQIIIFLNRRGYATCVLCRGCGHVLQCTNCRVSLTYHESDQTVRCHYCGLELPIPRLCPECRSRYLRRFGVGTQRVEEVLRAEFPGVRVLRMDMDTTRRKGAHGAILSRFGQGNADILLGTQMIAKGLDFTNVTLVGVITADTALNIPDFRAGERTFQLLTQVSGRAGRGDKEGEVIIQTYTPEHYSIQAAAQQDYMAFYRKELAFRHEMGYPPYSLLARLLVSGTVEEEVVKVAHRVADVMRGYVHAGELEARVSILGPSPAPLSMVRNRYRWHVLLKGEEATVRETLTHLTTASLNTDDCNVSIDVSPCSLL